MASNHLYNLEELLLHGLLDNNSGYQPINLLLIPRIQRSYAQGRMSEFDIRENILKEIFDALSSGKSIEMSFVYGSYQNGVFDILDGQQRLTTIFLVYWYVMQKENISFSWMDKFCYQTRKTSSDFIKKIISQKFSLSQKPSVEIQSQKWFVLSYRQDTTVTSMLTMLDSIHEHYNAFGATLASNLNKLNFYLISLNQYGLSEDLYIKMNARGLRLNPFDNFKADLVGFLKTLPFPYSSTSLPSGRLVPYHLYFSIQLDSNWIDLFWNIDKDNSDCLFFRFFYRYMANKYITHFGKTVDAEKMRDDIDYNFFSDISENDQEKYKGFSNYAKFLDNNIILGIERVLNLLKKHYFNDILPLLCSSWNENANMFGTPEKYQRKYQVLFCAITEYLEKVVVFDANDFRRWMRVVWNIVENSNIDGLRPQVAVCRRLVDILNSCSVVGSVYSGLSIYSASNLSAAVTEEIENQN